HCLVNEREIGAGKLCLRRLATDYAVPHVLDAVADLIEVGRAGDVDAVEVLGIALRRHQAFLAAGRAAIEVREFGRAAVEGFRDRLRLHRHLVDAARAIVDDLLVVLHPGGSAALMASVGARDRVALEELRRHIGVLDVARKAVVAEPLVLAVPAFEWKPYLELNLAGADGSL